MSVSIQEYYSLKNKNTLSFDHKCRYFSAATALEDIKELLDFSKQHSLPWLVLGEGSNIVLSGDYGGLIIHNRILGRELVSDDNEAVYVRIGAGENWHDIVQYLLHNNWYGSENLAMIPGTAGAAPVQNIGAYGVELCDIFHEAHVWDAETSTALRLDAAACKFSYRNSLFKEERGRYVILDITLRLQKKPLANIAYASLESYFAQTVRSPSPEQVFEAVVAIRTSKLPDPDVLPNVGSFFKNPQVSLAVYDRLKRQYPDLVSYPIVGSTNRKLAAAWLIDRAGWKGHRAGNVGVHSQQALVLVHTGGGRGHELMALANEIQMDIKARYDVELEIEPEVV